MKKYKVGIILPGKLPVPAVKGGAIETLMTSIVKKHNEFSDIELVVFSEYHKKAKKIADEHYPSVNIQWLHSNQLVDKFKKFMYRAIRKITKRSFCSLIPHYGVIYNKIKNDKMDLLIVQGGDANTVKKITRRLTHTKLAYHLHFNCKPEDTIKNYFPYIIATSDFIAKEYEKYSERDLNTYVVRNAINLAAFQKQSSKSEQTQLREGLRISKNDFVILFVGRLLPEKGIKELMEAIIHLNRPDIKLLVIGSVKFALDIKTEYSMKIEQMCNENQEKFIFTGYVENSQIYKYSDIADIQCVPSTCEEAAGLVVLEAMAKGLPTIVTKSGGMPEYVTEDTSIIVDKGEHLVENLEEAIIQLKNDTQKREKMGKAAKEHVKQYSEDHFYTEYCTVIKEILNENTCS